MAEAILREKLEERFASLTDAFRSCDKDCNGTISAAEFEQVRQSGACMQLCGSPANGGSTYATVLIETGARKF